MCNCACPYGSYPACRARRGERPCHLEEEAEDGGGTARLGPRRREAALQAARGRLAELGNPALKAQATFASTWG